MELARSNKRVKDVSHAGFIEDQGSGSSDLGLGFSSLGQAFTFWIPPLPFNDKLVGEIPRAYT